MDGTNEVGTPRVDAPVVEVRDMFSALTKSLEFMSIRFGMVEERIRKIESDRESRSSRSSRNSRSRSKRDSESDVESQSSSAARKFEAQVNQRRGSKVRNSLFGLPGATPFSVGAQAPIGARTPVQSGTPQPQVSIVVTATEIDEKDKLKHVTIKSIKWLITDKYANYLTHSLDKSKRLAHFVSREVMVSLMNDQKSRPNDLSDQLTLSNMVDLPDETLEIFLADLVRPKSWQKYRDAIFDHVESLKNAKVTFTLKGYDVNIHPRVCRILEEIEHYDQFFRKGASLAELARLPEMNWGTENNPGVFRIAMECFSPFQENYKNMLGEKNLKACTKMKDFIKMFRKINDEYSRKADELMILELSMEAPEKLKNSREAAIDKSMQRKLINGVPEKKRFADFKLLSESNHRKEDHVNFGVAGNFPSQDESDKEYDRRMKQYAEKPSQAADDGYRDVIVSEEAFMTDEVWNELRMIDSQRNQNNKFQKKPGGSYEAKPPDKKLPCFTQAYHNNCEAKDKCVYSHDPIVLQGYLNTEMKKIKGSPHFKDHSSYNSPRQHVLEIVNTGSDTESVENDGLTTRY